VKELVVISGKGGTGKTTVVGAFATLADDLVLADCDVDAANLHLLLKPKVLESHELSAGQSAVILEDKCIKCGRCQDECRFSAIEDLKVIKTRCEGCGVCEYVCPVDAIEMIPEVTGEYFVSDTRFGPLVHARLTIGAENSGKLVTNVRKKALDLAREKDIPFILTDGAPGVGCPVIASVSGADFALVVTEPTLSGISDLKRVVDLARYFRVKTLVCINKWDLNEGNSKKIQDLCYESQIPVIGRIPYDEEVTRAMVDGKTILEWHRGETRQGIEDMWERLQEELKGG
jgi:MinD superfamily P-loop ATPase